MSAACISYPLQIRPAPFCLQEPARDESINVVLQFSRGHSGFPINDAGWLCAEFFIRHIQDLVFAVRKRTSQNHPPYRAIMAWT